MVIGRSTRKSYQDSSGKKEGTDSVADPSDDLIRRFVGIAELQAEAAIERIEERDLFSVCDVEDQMRKVSGGKSESERFMDHADRKGIENKRHERMCESTMVGTVAYDPKDQKSNKTDDGGRRCFVYGTADSEIEKQINEKRRKYCFHRHRMSLFGVRTLEGVIVGGYASERTADESNHTFTYGLRLKNGKCRRKPYRNVCFTHHDGSLPTCYTCQGFSYCILYLDYQKCATLFVEIFR